MRRLLFLTVVFSGIFLLVWTIIFEMEQKEIVSEEREDLKKVVHANNNCSKYWRGELFDMWNNKTYDYTNDPIFLECKNFED